MSTLFIFFKIHELLEIHIFRYYFSLFLMCYVRLTFEVIERTTIYLIFFIEQKILLLSNTIYKKREEASER